MAQPLPLAAETAFSQPSPHMQAERAFHVYLDQSRAGEAPSISAFLASYPPDVRVHLELILEDYISLRGVLQPQAGLIAAGLEVGPFRLVREIGRGGMGCIWEAQQRLPRRVVALKILYPHLSFFDHSLERFEKEARACGRISHEHIVAIHEVGEHQGLHWIAMELVPGGLSLADMIAELRERGAPGKDHWLRCARLFRQIAAALWCAHEAGVVHRDIKPGNILLTPEGQPKVADFGLAKIQDDLTLSRSGRLSGTPYYMSPEQAASSRLGVDLRTDIYSLGVSLYETLTLERPHQGETQIQLLERILLDEAPDPRLVAHGLPRDLAAIVMKMMAKRRDRRYSSMAAVVDDLDRFLAGEPPVARVPGPLARLWRAARRRKTALALACALCVGFGIAAGLYSDAAESRETTTRSVDDALALSNTRAQVGAAGESVSHKLAASIGSRAASTADPMQAFGLHFDAARLLLSVHAFEGVLAELDLAEARVPIGSQTANMRHLVLDARARAMDGLCRAEERHMTLREAQLRSLALPLDDFRRARDVALLAASSIELGRPREAEQALASLPGLRSALLERCLRSREGGGPRAASSIEARLLLGELDAACGSPDRLEEGLRHFDEALLELRRSKGELDFSHMHAAWRRERAARRSSATATQVGLIPRLLRARADASQASRHRLVACLDLELAHAHLAAREFDEGAAAARAALAGFGPQAARHPLAFEAQGVLAGALLETGDARGALLAAEAHEAGWRTLAEADSARRLAADLLLARCGLVAHGKGHAPSLDRFGALELQLEGRAPDAEREPVSGEASLVAAVREELVLARRALARD